MALPMTYSTFRFAVQQIGCRGFLLGYGKRLRGLAIQALSRRSSGKEFETLCRVIEVMTGRSAKDATNQ